MNKLIFPGQIKLINLTPFKFLICSLIKTLLQNKTHNDKFNTLILFDGLKLLLNCPKCEISKENLINTIHQIITNLTIENNIPDKQQEIFTFILTTINSTYSSVKSMDDIYDIFNIQIRELRVKSEDNDISLETGGIFDNFIRKCLFAFYKLTFKDLCQFYSQLQSYMTGSTIEVPLTKIESQNLFQSQYEEHVKLNTDDVRQMFFLNDYKHKYFYMSKMNIGDELFLIHKFFDYNMSDFYNESNSAEVKIHYSLLNLVEYYYEKGYLDKALQVLFESVKLNQSNCHHEGLLKSFIWLSKIFRSLCNYDTANQFLCTSIINSFENNFHLLFLVSTLELSHLDFIYTAKENKANSIEEKILKYSKSTTHLFQTIQQFLSQNRNDYIYGKSFFHYVHFNLFLNLMRQGYYSLTLFLFEIIFDMTNTNKEYVETAIHILIELYDFDYDYVVKKLMTILHGETMDYAKMVGLIRTKFLSNAKCVLTTAPSRLSDTVGYLKLKYCELFSELLHSPTSKLEDKINVYKRECKEYKIRKYKELGVILLAKLYCQQKRFTEGLVLLNKIKSITGDAMLKIKCMLTFAYLYSHMHSIEKTRESLHGVESLIENSGDVWDKYDFYFLKTQIALIDKESATLYLNECVKNGIKTNDKRTIVNTFNLIRIVKQIDLSHLMNKHIKETESLVNLIEQYEHFPYRLIQIMSKINLNNCKLFDELFPYLK